MCLLDIKTKQWSTKCLNVSEKLLSSIFELDSLKARILQAALKRILHIYIRSEQSFEKSSKCEGRKYMNMFSDFQNDVIYPIRNSLGVLNICRHVSQSCDMVFG